MLLRAIYPCKQFPFFLFHEILCWRKQRQFLGETAISQQDNDILQIGRDFWTIVTDKNHSDTKKISRIGVIGWNLFIGFFYWTQKWAGKQETGPDLFGGKSSFSFYLQDMLKAFSILLFCQLFWILWIPWPLQHWILNFLIKFLEFLKIHLLGQSCKIGNMRFGGTTEIWNCQFHD